MTRRAWSILSLLLWAACAAAPAAPAASAPIDRQALVTRHNPVLTAIDPAAPLMVGNGSIAFTADITGLQTFPDQYSPLAPLLTQAQWSWHSFPNPHGYTLEEALVSIPIPGGARKYPALTNWDQAQAPHIRWLRENPHRFNLGRLALRLRHANGRAASFDEFSGTRQVLDMWSGRLNSRFVFDGVPVEVETSVHPSRDIVVVRLRSALLRDARLGVDLNFPGVGENLNPDPSDWNHPQTHVTREVKRQRDGLLLTRSIDDTRYFVRVAADRPIKIGKRGPHHFHFTTAEPELTLLVEYSPKRPAKAPAAETARAAVPAWWQSYWREGGMVDFSGSSDARAAELERRVVLSQYLSALNGAGYMPPQEEGLFSNSWNGKSHLEMHVWHSAHFAAWGRPQMLERSMGWYLERLEGAKRRARDNGVHGAWWPKMVGPEGRESPSTINPFIMWQQPHPIYLAELLYRAKGDRATLRRYAPLVFASADLLASWARAEQDLAHPDRLRYVLGPPVMPAQETFEPTNTVNPTFELEYWRFGLATAQAWRQRLGMARDPHWDDVLTHLAKLPVKQGLYLAAESQPELWQRAASTPCRARAASDCPNRDHPSLLAALGFLPGEGVDRPTMSRTLDAVLENWDLRQTWGWDWPLMAMTATRLGRSDLAVDLLLTDQANFQFGASGMTPRVQLTEAGNESASRRVAETYFPSNGSLLLAVALMVAGEGEGQGNAGFPQEGWRVRSEGIRPLP